jgi:hypothetical protein
MLLWEWLTVSAAYCLVGTGVAIGVEKGDSSGDDINWLAFLFLVVGWFPMVLMLLGLLLVDRLLDS